MEDLGSSGHEEGYGFDVGVVDGFEGAHDFVFVGVDATLGEEGNASLRIGGFVFREVFEFVVLVFKVANVTVTCACQQKLCE